MGVSTGAVVVVVDVAAADASIASCVSAGGSSFCVTPAATAAGLSAIPGCVRETGYKGGKGKGLTQNSEKRGSGCVISRVIGTATYNGGRRPSNHTWYQLLCGAYHERVATVQVPPLNPAHNTSDK